MREHYQQQVELLLDVLPFISNSEVFILKGGTAINFFYLDCPRLSVDIDLHYLPVNNRETALTDIHASMKEIAGNIQHTFADTTVRVDTSRFNAVVKRNNLQIKIEPNTVIRGCLLPVEKKSLSPNMEQAYGRAITVPCISKHELYAGKLCAALQRQHPRDLFDALKFLQYNELSKEMMDIFLVYLISQRKPIYEVLNPNRKDIDNLFYNQFVGMPTEDVALEMLKKVQNTLPQKVVGALTDTHRDFLIGFKNGTPDWRLLPYNNIQNLPAVLWKQQNLDKMDNLKRAHAIEKLMLLFEAIPYKYPHSDQIIEKEQSKVLTPQEQLTEEIIDALIESGLLNKAKEEEIKRRFATGQLKREDWSLYIELAFAPKVLGEGND